MTALPPIKLTKNIDNFEERNPVILFSFYFMRTIFIIFTIDTINSLVNNDGQIMDWRAPAGKRFERHHDYVKRMEPEES